MFHFYYMFLYICMFVYNCVYVCLYHTYVYVCAQYQTNTYGWVCANICIGASCLIFLCLSFFMCKMEIIFIYFINIYCIYIHIIYSCIGLGKGLQRYIYQIFQRS